MTHQRTINPSRRTQIEVGARTQLQLPGVPSGSNVLWVPDQPNIVALTPSDDTTTCDVKGTGFGLVTISATVDTQPQGTFLFAVGSVVIAGADDRYWQATYDPVKDCMVINEIDKPGLGTPLDTLVKANAVVADMTGAQQPTSSRQNPTPADTSVTCYLLNLKSLTIE